MRKCKRTFLRRMFTMRPDGEVHVAVQLERSAEKLPAQRNGVWGRCVGNYKGQLG